MVALTPTVGVTSDIAQRNGGAWPAWAVPARAVRAWVNLQAAVRALGRPPACAQDPEAWWLTGRMTVEARTRAAAAVEACSWCPVQELCAAYALEAREKDGIWGGLMPRDRELAW